MNIRTKITMITTIWLICILLLVNIFVYTLFIKITTDNEKDLLFSKAEQILNSFKARDVVKQLNNIELSEFLTGIAMIRILDINGKIINTAMDEENGIVLKPLPVRTDQYEVLFSTEDQRILVVRLPIVTSGQLVGTLEAAERMQTLEENLSILISVLIFSALGAVLLSLIGGFFLSDLILKPISAMIQIMEENETSMGFKKIRIRQKNKDELYKLANAFNRMMARLEQNFKNQKQFVSNASHELKTPITIIESYANILRRWGMNDENLKQEAVNSIYEEARRMKKLTQHLLELASTNIEPQLDIQQIDLVVLCEKLSRVIKKLYHRTVEIISSRRNVWILADEMKMKQLILILLDNAMKYSKQKIEVRLSEEEGAIEIRIKDYGIGIPKKEVNKVFERFYRVDQARQRKTGGSGLGLPIAKIIVAQHHGIIFIESEEGKGTEVIVRLPKTQENPV